jgi:hypothetical protein
MVTRVPPWTDPTLGEIELTTGGVDEAAPLLVAAQALPLERVAAVTSAATNVTAKRFHRRSTITSSYVEGPLTIRQGPLCRA